jgi:hypothetical protein
MMIARRLLGCAFLAAACVGFAGCAEDNEKAMMKAANTAPPAGVPAVAPSNEPPPPPGNDAEARKKYEMERQKKMYANYPGYNTKGR